MRKFFTLIVVLFFVAITPRTFAQGAHVVISQVYGGGGNSAATYQNDFVELFNQTNTMQSLNGWSIQYGSATGTTWQVTALSGSIIPGGYYLIKLASGGAVGSLLPTADLTGTTNMSATAGKVALVSSSTALSGACPAGTSIIDFIGYGTTANCYEGTAPSPGPGATSTNTFSMMRVNGGCTDNNKNSTDFSVVTVSPRNSATQTITCITGATLTTTLASAITVTTATSGGSISLDGGSSVTERGVAWAAHSSVSTADTHSSDGTGTGSFTSSITGLTGNTKYYYRAFATNATNIAYGTELNFITIPAAPGIAAASNISTTGFTANWTAPAGGSETFTYTLDVDDDINFGSVNASINSISAASLSANVTGLAASTTYYFRVKAVNGTGSSAYAVSGSVQTAAPATPVLSQGAALAAFGNACINTSAGPNSFTLNGSDLNGSNISISSLAGFVFAEAAGGPYTSSLSFAAGSSLSAKTIYVKFTPTAVQSYNGSFVVSGGGATSITVNASGAGINTPATVSTGSNIVAGTSSTLNGAINSTGCSTVTAYGFEYSTVSGFTNGTGTQVLASNLSSGSFNKTVSGLTGGITYYYKAFATDGSGTVYGVQSNFTASAVVPVVMAAQPLNRYTEDFSDIANWSNNFLSGNGANHFGGLSATGAGVTPNPNLVTIPSTSFATNSTSRGLQKGTGTLLMLATGSKDDTSSVAFDFYMDFTSMNAGTLSFDWASVNNSTGDRKGSLRVYASVDGVNFTQISAAAVLNLTNNVPSTGTVSSVAMPSIFNNSATARLRFYYYNGDGGTTGSRPKISIDNLTVTSVPSAPCVTPTAGPTALSFGALTDSTIQASFTAASPAANEYLVIASTNSSLTSNPIDGQVYNAGDNVGDGDVIAKGNITNFIATGLDGNTHYYFFIFPVNSVCTGGPLYSVANALTGDATTAAGLPQCAAPADQPGNFTLGSIGVNSISASFTAGSAGEYLVLQSTASSLGMVPVAGQVYNTGDVLGNAKVVQRGSSTSFTASNLNPGTTYNFFVFSLSSQGCLNGPVYNTINPLTGSQATMPLPACATPGMQPINLLLNATNSTVAGTFNGITNSNFQYLVVRSTSAILAAMPADNTNYNIGDGLGGGVVVSNSASTSFSSGGLNATTTYYFFVFSMDKNCSGGTKYLVSNPLTGSVTTTNTPPNNYYFGTLHAHSDYSDGNKDHPGYTPTDDYNYALGSHGMDFLGISEHNHFSSLDNPGDEIAKYHSGLVEAVNFTASHPGFLAMYGMEWGVISGGGHVVVYGDGLNDLFGWESNVNGNVGPNYDVYVPKSVYTGPTGLFKTVNDYAAKNGFANLAHPNSTDFNNLANLPYDAQADSAITGVAVESGPATSTNTTYSNPGSSMQYLWYYQKMLSKGYHLAPAIDHDNHNTTFGRTTNARTAVIAPALTQTEIVKAVHDMHFYATEDYDTKVDYTINNRIMGSVFEDRNAPTISVNVMDPTDDYSNALIRVMFGVPGSNVLPVVIDSVYGGSLSFVDNNLPINSAGYYYIDITNGTTRTVTAPIWYTRTCVITSELNMDACNSYTWNGTQYTSSTTVTKSFTTQYGCDSTVTLHLTIKPGPVSIGIQTPASVSSCPGTGIQLNSGINDGGNGPVTYQWTRNGTPVAGAGAANYTAMQSGWYNVTATSASGCSVTAVAVNLSIADSTAPVVSTRNIIIHLDSTGNAGIVAAQIDNGSADNCSIASMVLDKTSFSCANVGDNTVTLTVTDASGNVASGTAIVTVVDDIKPVVITRNLTITLDANGSASINAAQIDNGSKDNCSIAGIGLDKSNFSCADIGANTVTLTVTDANGNSNTATATVTVNGTLGIVAPNAIAATTDAGNCGATVSLGTPVVTHSCAITSLANNAPTTFPVGTTVVTWIVTDVNGSAATSVQQVIVTDNQKPVITRPGNYSVSNNTGECRATVNLAAPSVADNCGVASITNNHPSAYFPVGITIVVWTAIDIHGNASDTLQQTVTVIDNELPTITVSDIAVSTDAGVCGATVNIGTPMKSDNCGIASVTNDHSSTSFPVGVTYVHWMVTDVNGLNNTVTQKVTVTDMEKPAVAGIANQVFCANGSGNYTLPAIGVNDNCGIASVNYVITGATSRSGVGADASGNFATGSSVITWTVTDLHGNTSNSTATVTVNSLPVVTISASGADAFCNKLVLTANGGDGSTYQWYTGATPVASTQQLELTTASADGVYNIYATGNGCTSAAASYNYHKQDNSSSYTILTFKDARIGKYNKVNSGSVGVMGSGNEAEFKSYSSVTGTGAFVKAPRIDMIGAGIAINQQVIGTAAVVLPAMQFNTAVSKGLPTLNASAQDAIINGNYNNLTVKKGVSVTVTGNTFGTIKLEEGADIRFTSAVINIENFTADKGLKNIGYSYIRFAPGTAVRISGKVSIGGNVWLNPENNQVVFYMGDAKPDEEKITINGSSTHFTANVLMPHGKLKVLSTDADNEDQPACDHSAHAAASCKHKGHDHNDCDHRAHNAADCSDNVYMTGLFIAESLESRGNTVTWNSFTCGTPPAVLNETKSAATLSITSETAKSDATTEDLKVTVMPNPSTNYFTLKFESRFETPLHLRVLDASGRVVDSKSKIGANSTLRIGEGYSSGKYYAEVTQAGRRRVVQLIKGRG